MDSRVCLCNISGGFSLLLVGSKKLTLCLLLHASPLKPCLWGDGHLPSWLGLQWSLASRHVSSVVPMAPLFQNWTFARTWKSCLSGSVFLGRNKAERKSSALAPRPKGAKVLADSLIPWEERLCFSSKQQTQHQKDPLPCPVLQRR